MTKSIFTIALIFTVFTMVAQTPVGKWERNGVFYNINNNGSVNASNDSNTNRKWSAREGYTYNFRGAKGEQLILTLLENSEYFSLSNGQLWKRVSTISDDAGGWTSSGNTLQGGFNSKTNNQTNAHPQNNQATNPPANTGTTPAVKQTNEEWVNSIVVGVWKYTYNDKTWTINANGTAIASWDKTNKYRWKYLRQDRIKIWSETSVFGSEVLIMNKGERIVVQLSGDHFLKVSGTPDKSNTSETTSIKQTNEQWVNSIIPGRWKNPRENKIFTFNTDGTVQANWDSSARYRWKYLRPDHIKVWSETSLFYSEVVVMNQGKRIVFQLSGDHYLKME